jgi:Protein of unknown function (DUF3276)
MESIFSSRIRAGKRRTYFFDVRETRGNDYYLTITESRKKFDDNGYERHKIFLYKEDFNKFIKALGDATDYVKTELMPDFDFDAFNHDNPEGYEGNAENNGEAVPVTAETISDTPVEVEVAEPLIEAKLEETPASPVTNTSAAEEVDKW